ncbi:MAG: cobalamin-binding protein [Chromatiales bacterium]|nr:cobalamin-binding protein [Chromatiales bacterium]
MASGASVPQRFVCFSLLAALALISWRAAANSITEIDARGHTVTLAQPAARIISLSPHVTELLYVAGAGDRLIAAVDFSDYPEAARHLPRVGNSSRLDVERVLALKPDLAIGWKSGNSSEDIARLEKLGVHVYVTEVSGVAAIADDIETLGRLAGTSDVAQIAGSELREQIAALSQRYTARVPVTVFYQIWAEPLMTINGRHFISDSLRICGGRNIFQDLEPVAPTVTVEAVIAADPQVIVSSSSKDDNDEQLASWRRWNLMRAVRANALYTIAPDLITRPSARIVEGVEQLCVALDRARAQADVQPRSLGERQ